MPAGLPVYPLTCPPVTMHAALAAMCTQPVARPTRCLSLRLRICACGCVFGDEIARGRGAGQEGRGQSGGGHWLAACVADRNKMEGTACRGRQGAWSAQVAYQSAAAMKGRGHIKLRGARVGAWERLAVKGVKSTRTEGAEKNTGGNCNSAPRRTHVQVSCRGWLLAPLLPRYLGGCLWGGSSKPAAEQGASWRRLPSARRVTPPGPVKPLRGLRGRRARGRAMSVGIQARGAKHDKLASARCDVRRASRTPLPAGPICGTQHSTHWCS